MDKGRDIYINNSISDEKPQHLTTMDDNVSSRDLPQTVDEFVDDSMILTKPIKSLLIDYTKELIDSGKGYTPIHVDEIASRLARFYETIRKIIDWKDDSVLRRAAIGRVLKRIMFPKIAGIVEQNVDVDILAETLTTELIRGGHLPNDTIPVERINFVSESLKKYLYFLDQTSSYKTSEVKKRVNYTTFILEIASCEIEEILTRPVKEYGIIDTMTKLLSERTNVLPKDKLSEIDKLRQMFIATCKTLYDLDDNFIIYRLLRAKYPNWQKLDDAELEQVLHSLKDFPKEYEKELKFQTVRKFSGLAEKVDTAFLLIDDVLESLKDNPRDIIKNFESKKKFKKHITSAYEKRYKTLKRRLFRLAIFSTLSVFLSNWFTFYIVEVPLAKLFYEGFSFAAAVVDFAIPTIVMFLLVIIIKPPRKNNVNKVLSTTLSFVYRDENSEHYQVKIKSGRPSIFQVVLMALYIYIMFLVFIGIGSAFFYAKLPLTSVIFDTFTIALTVFAAVTIKNKARELNVDEHTSVGDFLLDIISVPIAKVGSFFAAKWKEYNVVAILFTFIIETPFAMLLNFIQGWSEFIKERRSELH